MSDAEVGAAAAQSSTVTNNAWQTYFSKEYMLSLPGILRAAETVLSLTAFICSASARNLDCNFLYAATYNFFEFVSMSAFIAFLFLYVIYVLSLSDKLCFKFVAWNPTRLLWGIADAILYLISSSVMAAHACHQSGNVAAAVFGFLILALLVVDLLLTAREFQYSRQEAALKARQQAEVDQGGH